MAINVQARRELDAGRQLTNLEAEMTRWKTAAQRDLPQHFSQINSAHRTLAVVLNKLKVNTPPLAPETYKRLILSAHRVWDFFQSKFAQRGSTGFKEFLDIADQFAYDCYRGVGDFVKKAPPLVVLSGASQPYVQKRESPFVVEGVATQESLTDLAIAATASLPFPVIGVPWSQAAQLEGLVAIGHEVGHAVEDDLGLTAQLQKIFEDNCPPERSPNWRRWQRELFADIWGCLSTGPAFVYGLADYLAPVRPWKEPIDPASVYPPSWLRVRFAHAVVKLLSSPAVLPPPIATLLEEWERVFLVDEKFSVHLDDIKGLQAALFDATYPGINKLGSAFKFAAADYDDALAVAQGWLPRDPGLPPVRSSNEGRMRIVVAATRLAYEAEPAAGVVEKKMVSLTRAVSRDRRTAPMGQAQADRDRAAKLFDLLTLE